MGHFTGNFGVESAAVCKEGAIHALFTILPGGGDSVDFRLFCRYLPYGHVDCDGRHDDPAADTNKEDISSRGCYAVFLTHHASSHEARGS
jgi:hypothetical protein